MAILKETYFQERDSLEVAQALIGCRLHRIIQGQEIIVELTETEAYRANDKACHAYGAKKTPRTQILFEPGGKVYTYLCYGIHHLFNITCGPRESPQAVLVRAARVLQGEDLVRQLRNREDLRLSHLLRGPGNLAKGLNFNLDHYGHSIDRKDLFLEEPASTKTTNILSSKRIGVEYAQEDASLPYRFYQANEDSVSKG